MGMSAHQNRIRLTRRGEIVTTIILGILAAMTIPASIALLWELLP